MRDMIFIGDAVTAAGFRLAGVPSFAPEPAGLAAVVGEERKDCRILAMTAATLDALPEPLARELVNASEPLLAILPDARDTMPVPDLEAEVRRALGIEV